MSLYDMWAMSYKNRSFKDPCRCPTKRSLGSSSPVIPSFHMTLIISLLFVLFIGLYFIVGIVPKEVLAGLVKTTKITWLVFLVTQLMCHILTPSHFQKRAEIWILETPPASGQINPWTSINTDILYLIYFQLSSASLDDEAAVNRKLPKELLLR